MENGSKVGQNAVAAAAEKYLGDLSEKHGTIFTNLVMVLDSIKALGDNQKPGVKGVISIALAATAFNELTTTLGQNPQKLVDAAIGLDAVLTQAAKDADRP